MPQYMGLIFEKCETHKGGFYDHKRKESCNNAGIRNGTQ